MNTKYAGTLESSRNDGKLAFTKNIFDNTTQDYQENINKKVNKSLTDNNKSISDEVIRATKAEQTLTDAISDEVTRAVNSENVLGGAINSEIARAKTVEQTIIDNHNTDINILNNTVNDVKTVVTNNKNELDNKIQINTNNILDEKNRAYTKEENLQHQINDIIIDPITYEEVVAKGLNDLNDRIIDIGIQTPIMKKLVDWYDAKDINYYDDSWYSRTSTNKIAINDLNYLNRPKENDITTLETILYNLANKSLLANNYSNYRTTSLLIGINYESQYNGVLFKITTLNKYINISINENLLISVDTYNKSDDSFISNLGTYQCNTDLININLNRYEKIIRINLINEEIAYIDLSNFDNATQPKDTILSTGNWTDVTLKSILIYNNVISEDELIYNYNYFKSREYKFINRINHITELIPNNTKISNELDTIKNLIATAVGVDGNKLILINKNKSGKMYYGNTLTTNKNFIYAGPFDNTECFSTDGNPDINMVEEIINLPTNINRTDFTKYFKGCIHLKYINLSNLNTDSMTIAKEMFMGCESLINLDVSYIKMNNVTDASFMLKGVCAKNIAGFNTWNMSKCTTLESIFENSYIKNFNGYQNWDTTLCTSIKSTFANFINTEDCIDILNWNISNILDASMAFKGCRSSIIDINSNFNKCINFSEMFRDCINLKYLYNAPFSQFTGTIYSNMFNNCNKATTINIGYINAAILIDGMFKDCKSLTGFNMSSTLPNVIDASFLFSGCMNLRNIDNFGNVTLANCINANGMFDGCCSLYSLDLHSIDTIKMTSLPTFKNCNNLIGLNLSTNYFNSAVTVYDFSDLTNLGDDIHTIITQRMPTITNPKTIILSPNTKALVTDTEKNILISKNWILA